MAINRSQHGRLGTLRFDVLAAVLGLIIGIALVPLRFLASQIFIETIPLLLILACLLYLFSVYRDEPKHDLPALPSVIALSLPSFVLLGQALLIAIVVAQGARSRVFFAGAILIGTLILVQILHAHHRDFNTPLLLVQILSFAFVFRFSALYVTPGFIGVDIWTHMIALAEPIHAEGSLDAIAHDKHYASPFFHLVTVSAAFLYDVPIRAGLYLSIGLALPISILLVYATTALLVPDRWAVLAAALFAFADYIAHWGMHLIPTSLGLVFFLGVLYLLVRIMHIEFARRDYALLVVLSVAIIFTHQISTLIMLVLLGAAFVAQLMFQFGPFGFQQLHPNVFRAHRPVNMVGLVVFNSGLTIFAWSLTPFRQETFLATVLSWFRETLVEGAGFLNLARPADSDGGNGGEAAGPSLLDQIVQHVEVAGFLLLLGLAFVGCLYIVRRERSQQSVFTLLLATALMLVFILGFPILGIRNFVPTRWYAFLYAPLVILCVIGLRHLSFRLGTGTVISLLLVLALVYPAGMMLASPSHSDNPVFPDHHERLAYNEAELSAVSSIERMTGGPSASDIRPDQVLFTDHPYHTVIRRTHAHYAEPATIVADEPVDHQVTVYREAQTTRTTFFRDADGVGQPVDIPEERLCRGTQARIYTNGQVSMCSASPATA